MHRDADTDRHWLATVHAVVIEKGFCLVNAVGEFGDLLADNSLGLIPVECDAGLHGIGTIFCKQVLQSPFAKTARGDLGTKVTKASFRIADVVTQDAEHALVRYAAADTASRCGSAAPPRSLTPRQ